MDKAQFENRLKPLGKFKRAYKGYSPANPDAFEDLVFVPFVKTPICPLCNKSHRLYIERRDEGYWRVKCPSCKEKWIKNSL